MNAASRRFAAPELLPHGRGAGAEEGAAAPTFGSGFSLIESID